LTRVPVVEACYLKTVLDERAAEIVMPEESFGGDAGDQEQRNTGDWADAVAHQPDIPVVGGEGLKAQMPPPECKNND
jgi:hypothetical protein